MDEELGIEVLAAAAVLREADHDYGMAVSLAALLELVRGDGLEVSTSQRGGQTLVVLSGPAGEFTIADRRPGQNVTVRAERLPLPSRWRMLRRSRCHLTVE
jgi:hypothetical protein